MSHLDNFPFLTRLEARLSAIPAVEAVFTRLHQQRKKVHTARLRRQDAANPGDLRNFEKKVFSQYGEDGTLEEIFRRIGEGSKLAVEFGIESGHECNSRNLIENHQWSAVLFDGSAAYVEAARKLYANRPVMVQERFLEPDNILDIFRDAGIPVDFDLLSVDVDGNDYWLCKAVLTRHRPRVVVMEYNGRWRPPVEWIMPYERGYVWDRTAYYGASLQSETNLLAGLGYQLVGCSAVGLNAFFVRRDAAEGKFGSAEKGPRYHYASPLYVTSFGHPLRPPVTVEKQ